MTLLLRDMEPAQARNICAALVPESRLVFRALKDGGTIAEVRAAALDGTLFRQRSYLARRRFWHAIHSRYLGHGVDWVIQELIEVVGTEELSAEGLGLLYMHFVLRDHLTQDLLTGPIWSAWLSGQLALDRHEILGLVEQVAPDFFASLTEGTRNKLGSSLLSAFRDYGLCRGVQTKHLVRPPTPPRVVAHVLRVLVEEGHAGMDVVTDPTWRAFLLSPDDVAARLSELAQARFIRFERAGGTVVLETPWGNDGN